MVVFKLLMVFCGCIEVVFWCGEGVCLFRGFGEGIVLLKREGRGCVDGMYDLLRNVVFEW